MNTEDRNRQIRRQNPDAEQRMPSQRSQRPAQERASAPSHHSIQNAAPGRRGRSPEQLESRTAGQAGSRTAGQPGSRTVGQTGGRTTGQQGSRTAGQQGSRTAGQQGSRTTGQPGGRTTGQKYRTREGSAAERPVRVKRPEKPVEHPIETQERPKPEKPELSLTQQIRLSEAPAGRRETTAQKKRAVGVRTGALAAKREAEAAARKREAEATPRKRAVGVRTGVLEAKIAAEAAARKRAAEAEARKRAAEAETKKREAAAAEKERAAITEKEQTAEIRSAAPAEETQTKAVPVAGTENEAAAQNYLEKAQTAAPAAELEGAPAAEPEAFATAETEGAPVAEMQAAAPVIGVEPEATVQENIEEVQTAAPAATSDTEVAQPETHLAEPDAEAAQTATPTAESEAEAAQAAVLSEESEAEAARALTTETETAASVTEGDTEAAVQSAETASAESDAEVAEQQPETPAAETDTASAEAPEASATAESETAPETQQSETPAAETDTESAPVAEKTPDTEKGGKKKKGLNRYHQILIFLLTILLIIVLLVVLFVLPSKRKGAKDDNFMDQIRSQQIRENDVAALDAFFNLYYTALASGNTTELEAMYDVPSKANITTEISTIVNKYDNIKVYVTQGIEEDDIVAFVSNDIHFANIEATAPSVDSFYLTYDPAEAVLRIRTDMYTDPDILKYMNLVSYRDPIRTILADTNVQLNQKLAENKDLNNLYILMQTMMTSGAEELTDESPDTKETTQASKETEKETAPAANEKETTEG